MRKETASYVEMLFENRNKAYGAYELRTKYENRLLLAFGLALVISGVFFLIPYSLTQILTSKEVTKLKEAVALHTKQIVIEKDSPGSQATKQQTKTKAGNSTFKIVKKEEIIKSEPVVKQDPAVVGSVVSVGGTDSTAVANAAGSSASTGLPVVQPAMSAAAVDIPPVFPGGEEALMKYLRKRLKFTNLARENKISGRVYANFIVNETGLIESIEIIRGLGFGLDEEVTRVISSMPNWIPGKFQGQSVKTVITLPVHFSLK